MELGVDFYAPEVFLMDAPIEELGHKFDRWWYLPCGNGHIKVWRAFHAFKLLLLSISRVSNVILSDVIRSTVSADVKKRGDQFH